MSYGEEVEYGDRFRWKLSPNSRRQVTARYRTVEFGDGFEQRLPESLKNTKARWSITVDKCDHIECAEIEAFIELHMEFATNFEVQHPDTGRWYRVKPISYTTSWTGWRDRRVSVTAEEINQWPR